MTRENKLALVVGFGLILVVGILVSDHFSVARAQETADFVDAMGADDPLVAQRTADPELIMSSSVEPPLAMGPHAGTPAEDPVHPTPAGADGAGAHPPSPPPVADPLANAPTVRVTRHVIRPHESLTHICRAFYGTDAYVDELAVYNELASPDLVRQGRTLLLPDASALIGGSSTPATVRVENYTVAEGDSLSTIAGKLLGSRNLYLRLYDANRDQLDSPDDIQPGMTLRIPG